MKHGLSTHTYGFLITLMGVLILCPDTLLIRLVQAEGGSQWTIAFWRGVLTAVGLMVFFRLAEGRGSLSYFFRVDKWVIAAALTMGIQALAFILSIANTSVANTLIIVATGPLFTAVFAWAFLNERPPVRTWITIAVAFTGMLVIFYHDLGSVSLLGDALALVTAVGLGITFVIVRHQKAVNMMPAMSIGKMVSAIAVFPLAAPFDMTAAGFGLMFFLGLVVLPLSFGLLTLGPRYIPAPEVSLLLLLETVLGPLIVWVAINEAASASTLVGGAIVLAALAGNAAVGLWTRGQARTRPV